MGKLKVLKYGYRDEDEYAGVENKQRHMQEEDSVTGGWTGDT